MDMNQPIRLPTQMAIVKPCFDSHLKRLSSAEPGSLFPISMLSFYGNFVSPFAAHVKRHVTLDGAAIIRRIKPRLPMILQISAWNHTVHSALLLHHRANNHRFSFHLAIVVL